VPELVEDCMAGGTLLEKYIAHTAAAASAVSHDFLNDAGA
jgi:hypothetical protein